MSRQEYFIDEETYLNTGEVIITDRFENIVNISLLNEDAIILGDKYHKLYKVINDNGFFKIKERSRFIRNTNVIQKPITIPACPTKINYSDISEMNQLKDTIALLSRPLLIEQDPDSFSERTSPNNVIHDKDNTLSIPEITDNLDLNNKESTLLSKYAKNNYFASLLQEQKIEEILKEYGLIIIKIIITDELISLECIKSIDPNNKIDIDILIENWNFDPDSLKDIIEEKIFEQAICMQNTSCSKNNRIYPASTIKETINHFTNLGKGLNIKL